MNRILSVTMGFLLASALLAQGPWVYRNDSKWDPSWNRRAMPRAGACFFKDAGFQGDRFCVNKGDRLPALPGNFGDNISSMQLFGKARATVFNDRNFSGGSEEFRQSVSDLSRARFRDGHTWNNRISSLTIR
jgi:hypothetical protein